MIQAHDDHTSSFSNNRDVFVAQTHTYIYIYILPTQRPLVRRAPTGSNIVPEIAVVHLLWHLGFLVFAVRHGVVDMGEDGIDGPFVGRIEREEGDEVVVVDLGREPPA